MLERLNASPKARSLLRLQNARIEVHPEGWRKYRLHLNRFLGLLYILVHTDDVPGRGVEMLPIRHVNVPQNRRNIFMYDGQVVVVTGYHKSQAITGQQKVIARFLGRRISQLFLLFLADVLPFVGLMDRNFIPKSARCVTSHEAST